MNSEEFENRARLYVLGALDDEELAGFERGATNWGPRRNALFRSASG